MGKYIQTYIAAAELLAPERGRAKSQMELTVRIFRALNPENVICLEKGESLSQSEVTRLALLLDISTADCEMKIENFLYWRQKSRVKGDT